MAKNELQLGAKQGRGLIEMGQYVHIVVERHAQNDCTWHYSIYVPRSGRIIGTMPCCPRFGVVATSWDVGGFEERWLSFCQEAGADPFKSCEGDGSR